MRYLRVLSLLSFMAAVGLAAVAVGRSSPTPSPSHVRRLAQQEAKQLLVRASHKGAYAPSISMPAPQLGGTTCFVATQCSIKPCVVPVASAVPAPTSSPSLAATPPRAVRARPSARNGCPSGDRVPKTIRVVAAP